MMITTKIKNFLLSSKRIQRSAVFWNALSATMNSFQTMVLLMVITRRGTMDDSGIFVIAYAVGNLMLNVGKFGVRQFQVTDLREKYSFNTYVHSRKISSLLMIILSVAYIGYNIAFNQYSAQKSIVILLICATKLIEAYEDVYHGLMQQKGRLDVASKILAIRLSVFVVGCAVVFLITADLIVTLTINTIVTLLLALFLNRIALNGLQYTGNKTDSGRVFDLIRECFPLCACMCMNMYVANAPKYIIDSVVDSEVQTCFNIVFMPVFIIALLANFIFQPCLKDLGNIWAEENLSGFIKRICMLAGVVVAACAAVTAVGAFIGTDVLGYIYKVDLSEYNRILIIFMLSGGIIALQNLFIMAITVVRYQKYMIFGYILAAVLLLVSGKFILNKNGIFSLSLFFMSAMALLLLYCVILLLAAVKKKSNKIQR